MKLEKRVAQLEKKVEALEAQLEEYRRLYERNWENRRIAEGVWKQQHPFSEYPND